MAQLDDDLVGGEPLALHRHGVGDKRVGAGAVGDERFEGAIVDTDLELGQEPGVLMVEAELCPLGTCPSTVVTSNERPPWRNKRLA